MLSGLLPLLEPIHVQVNMDSLAGKRVGIDGFVWIHKGAVGNALDLALGNSIEPKNKSYVSYCLKQAKELIRLNVKPILVFDGGTLPSKGSSRNVTDFLY